MSFARELIYAQRALRRNPAVSVTATLILALGIGVTTAMLTLFDAVVLRDLPIEDPGGVVAAHAVTDAGVEVSLNGGHLAALRRDSRTFIGMAGFNHVGAMEVAVSTGDRPLPIRAAVVTGDFFDVMGTTPALGRLLRPDDQAASRAIAVISHRAWLAHFSADPGVLGQSLDAPQIGRSFEIVGVARAGLDYPTGTGFWILAPPESPPGLGFDVVGRLAPGTSIEAARKEFLSITRRLHETDPLPAVPADAEVRPLAHAVLGETRAGLYVMTAAVALLLLIACVNVGNLLLLRASSRAHEITVRRALGAGTGRIARLLFAESAVLGVVGGVLGVGLGLGLLEAVRLFGQNRIPRLDVLDLAGRPAAVGVTVTVTCVLVFGVLPALASARGDVAERLRAGSRAVTSTRRRRRVRGGLVATQVALAVVMLAGAGLLVRTLDRLQTVELGYAADRLSVLELSIPATGYPTPEARNLMFEELYAELRAIPGVTGLTPIVLPPFSGANVWSTRLIVEGDAETDEAGRIAVPIEAGGEEYFSTFDIPLLRGRGFLASDRRENRHVAVVSEALANRFWPGQDPIGRRLRLPGSDTTGWRTVVGVAGDIRFRRLRESDPTLFLPWRQLSTHGSLAVRTSVDLEALLPAMRATVGAYDDQILLWEAGTLEDYLAAPLRQPRLSAVLLGVFGLAALLVAASGLFGILATMVRERTRDLGIRMALGAARGRIRRGVVASALGVTSAGVLVGLAIALAGARVLRSFLYEISPADPVTLVGVAGLLVLVALLAAYLPARRATRIDPVEALRAD